MFNEIIASLSARTDVIFSGKLINKQKEFEKTIDEKIEEPNFLFEITEIKNQLKEMVFFHLKFSD